MKSLGSKRGGGNINLRGKKTKKLGCRCCEMINPKDKLLKKEHAQEINSAIDRT